MRRFVTLFIISFHIRRFDQKNFVHFVSFFPTGSFELLATNLERET